MSSKPKAASNVTDSIMSYVKQDADQLAQLKRSVETVFMGKSHAVDLSLTALLAGGHVLFEDVPGTGKTTLARSLAQSLECSFRRIQFTSDLLPSDVVGTSIYQEKTRSFELTRGPIFASIILADEINRTTPRTQSCLLEAMSEGTVTIDNTTHELPRPFMVIATQNPKEFHGTYPLPESQLDRFLLRLDIGYPEVSVEREIVQTHGHSDKVLAITPVATADDVSRWQARIEHVVVEPAVLDYLMSIVEQTRSSAHLALGVSTRGAIALYKAVQAKAYLDGRHYVTPDDIQALVGPVFSHRVWVKAHYEGGSAQREQAGVILAELVDSVPVPR